MENQGWVIPTEHILPGRDFQNKILRQYVVLKAVKAKMRNCQQKQYKPFLNEVVRRVAIFAQACSLTRSGLALGTQPLCLLHTQPVSLNATSFSVRPGLCFCHKESLTGSFKALRIHIPKIRKSGRGNQGEQMENLNFVFSLGDTPRPPRAMRSYSGEEF